jgi:hypothetical protein
MQGKDHAILDRIQEMRKEQLAIAEKRSERASRRLEARPW